MTNNHEEIEKMLELGGDFIDFEGEIRPKGREKLSSAFLSLIDKERERVYGSEDWKTLRKLLTYIATRNELHNGVCIPAAKDAIQALNRIENGLDINK